MLGLALLLAALLTVSVTGGIMAASDNGYNYQECPGGEPYGDDIPNLWGEPGPHGQGNVA